MSTTIDTDVHMEHEACRKAFLRLVAGSSWHHAKRGAGGDHTLTVTRREFENFCRAIGITHVLVGENIFDAVERLADEVQ